MDIKALILKQLQLKKELKTIEIVNKTGLSRAYVNRFFNELQDEGKIILVGKANQAKYLLADQKIFDDFRQNLLKYRQIFASKGLSEDIVLAEIKKRTGILMNLPTNILNIIGFSFTEMLNNAIDHSKSDKIEVFMERDILGINFSIIDQGVGIFNNLIKKKGLKNELEAIQELEKGKQTTDPEKHTGEGIFFTSKMADILTIQGSNKKLIFNNILQDIFVSNIKKIVGTKVLFSIALNSTKNTKEIFDLYTDTDDDFEFNKTDITVKLYNTETSHISRSQAKRILVGLEKFKIIILDFKGVDTVGQAFADEIFRVWQNNHREIKILPQNTNEDVMFMIKRAMVNK